MHAIWVIILLSIAVILYKVFTLGLVREAAKSQSLSGSILGIIAALGQGFFVSWMGMLMVNAWLGWQNITFTMTYWATFFMYWTVNVLISSTSNN